MLAIVDNKVSDVDAAKVKGYDGNIVVSVREGGSQYYGCSFLLIISGYISQRFWCLDKSLLNSHCRCGYFQKIRNLFEEIQNYYVPQDI